MLGLSLYKGFPGYTLHDFFGKPKSYLEINFCEEHFEFLLQFGGCRDQRIVRVAIPVRLCDDPPHVVGKLHRVAVQETTHSLLDLKIKRGNDISRNGCGLIFGLGSRMFWT
jgi:hypothetical protein